MFLLLALLGLVLLRLTRAHPARHAAAAPLALLACVLAGLSVPDLDQPLPLDHRSALTHGIAPALGIAAVRWARAAAAGLALGIGLHLAADIFPNAMVGYATVAVPFAGRIGAQGSYAWLIANTVACALVGLWLLGRAVPHPRLQAAVLIGTAIVGLWYLPRVDGGWWTLLVLSGLAWLIVRRHVGRLHLPWRPRRAKGAS